MAVVPDIAACEELMKRYAMLPNIVRHSFRVCQVASFLGRELNRNRNGLDLGVIAAASLLHDITKTRALETKENHAETGRDLLAQLGHPEVAEVVGLHVKLVPGQATQPLDEATIVNYADKRVLHERVVSLKERFADLQVRYGISPASGSRIAKIKQELFDLEIRIFDLLDFDPNRLEGFNSVEVFDLEIPPPTARG